MSAPDARSPLEARGEACRAEFSVERFQFVCPGCGAAPLSVLRGEHLILPHVTLERAGGEP